ncbi:hypothetical protein [Pseudozobellia thermophila]|uniref:Membrane domain of glycerophosphoryl diester phosphodiesterase n=1 Tax=Pseudozobellia thermophila TaxID=192903 RepID=A0A1M6MKR5_9FLAO|nr:hypothetical protein [Pseudozobellia thermophila]SHJ83873.1 hypothetical protein SAMN04488513_11029 [Pseudozobellia thermophila]
MKQYIEFKKQRELGEIISDTFAFLRNEFKPFFNTFLKIIGPYLVVLLICYVLYMYLIGDFFNFDVQSSNEALNGLLLFAVAAAFVLSMIVTYVLSQATTLFYIKSYTNNKGVTDFNEIKKEVYASFWSFVGLGILVGICVGVGFMFCILPGVYLYVPLVLSFSIMVFNQKNVSDAFGYSFTLVKDHWWTTFAALFVVGIIVYVASMAFSIPATIYNYAKLGILSGEIDAENFTTADPVSLLLGSISTLAQFLLNLVSVVASVFVYFNLNEKKNFTGTYERIKNLGERE